MHNLVRPAWLSCFLLLVLHQFVQKTLSYSILWVDAYLDCLLCMPIFLGALLFERQFLLRKKAYVFSLLDTLIMTILLGVLFEEIFPRLSANFTRDPWDYLCYFIGSLFFYFFIRLVTL